MMMVMMSPSMASPSGVEDGAGSAGPLLLSRNHPLGRVRYTPKGVIVGVVAATSTLTRPITVALVDDYDVVVMGVANILDQYRDRVVVAEIDTNRAGQRRRRHRPVRLVRPAGVRPRRDQRPGQQPERSPGRRLHLELPPDLVEGARQQGVSGYLSKALPARELVAALEACTPARSWSARPPGRSRPINGLDWPGRGEGLTDRESEILALITQGLSNADVARLTYLSPNTVKSYIRTIYRKIGVASRTQAVLWGVRNGFTPDHRRIDHWRGGP